MVDELVRLAIVIDNELVVIFVQEMQAVVNSEIKVLHNGKNIGGLNFM